VSNDLLMLKGMISELDAETKAKVLDQYESLKAFVTAGGGTAIIAFSLLGLELQEQA